MMDNHKISKPILVEAVGHDNPYDFSQIHRHSYFEIMLFENGDGAGINTIDFKDYPISSQSLHIVYPNQVHLMKRTDTNNGIIIQFTKEYLVNSAGDFHPEWLFILQSNPMTILKPEQFDQLFRLFAHLKDLTETQNTFHAQLMRHHFLYTIFTILDTLNNDTKGKSDKVSLSFLILAETHFREKRTVSAYADMMNISIKKLNTEVKNGLGKTPLQLLHDLLAIEIKRLMLVEDLSQKEISHLLNFDSQASYTRFVTKYFDLSPSQLKQSLRE